MTRATPADMIRFLDGKGMERRYIEATYGREPVGRVLGGDGVAALDDDIIVPDAAKQRLAYGGADDRDAKVLHLLRTIAAAGGTAPTNQQIADLAGLFTPDQASMCVTRLHHAGSIRIERVGGKWRFITVDGVELRPAHCTRAAA